MSLTMIGRTALRRMITIAREGAAMVTFRLIESSNYNPTTGQNVDVAVTQTVKCFLMRGDDKETKLGGVIEETFVVVLEDGILPRVPSDQDEVTIAGDRYTVTDVKTDPMRVQLKITVCRA